METKLEKLLNKIEEDGQREIELLEKEAHLEIEKIKRLGEKVCQETQEEEEIRMKREKERALEDYRKEKEFKLNMKLLELKTTLFQRAIQETQKESQKLSSDEKQEIFKKILKKVNPSVGEKTRVTVSSSLKLDFLKELNVSEQKVIRDDSGRDFVIEDEGFLLEVSLPEIVSETVDRESDYFARLLFKK